VDVLAAGTGRTHRIDADIFRPDVDVDLLDFGQDSDGRGRGMDAPRAFRHRHALHAVHAALELQAREDALAGDRGDGFLVAADFTRAFLEHGELPAMEIGIALVHAEEIAGEQSRLVAAGA